MQDISGISKGTGKGMKRWNDLGSFSFTCCMKRKTECECPKAKNVVR